MKNKSMIVVKVDTVKVVKSMSRNMRSKTGSIPFSPKKGKGAYTRKPKHKGKDE